MAVIGEIRREKAEKKMPLNGPVAKLTVYANNKETSDIILAGGIDISGTCKIANFEVLASNGEGREIAQFPDIHLVTEY
ncbi:MAG: hypothetical protein GX638_13825 [Crenarchaeota archaeon]|nr:hypothetical protein [Thermoproteota archaeon]